MARIQFMLLALTHLFCDLLLIWVELPSSWHMDALQKSSSDPVSPVETGNETHHTQSVRCSETLEWKRL